MANQEDAGHQSSHYTHLLIGTSLTLSILSAALSQSDSNKILHVDPADYYGSHNASLTLTQLVERIRDRAGRHDSSESGSQWQVDVCFPYFENDQGEALSSSATIPASLQSLDRHYSLSLSPALQPAISPSLDVLIRSQVAKYATFRLLQRTAVWDRGTSTLRTVPASKEDVFKSGELRLIEKRKLMKFLQFAATYEAPTAGDAGTFKDFIAKKFSLPPHLITAIMYGIALCASEEESTIIAMQRLKVHLNSVGRYGNSAYLVPQYGGAGEIAQGYCRAAAVHGATFILGKDIEYLSEVKTANEKVSYKLKLQDIEEVFTARTVIGEEELVSPIRGTVTNASGKKNGDVTTQRLLQAILVLDRGVRIPAASSSTGSAPSGVGEQTEAEPPLETGLIVFPPGSLTLEEERYNENTVTALILGEGTFCCPKGQYVVHITTEIEVSSKDGGSGGVIRQTVAAARAKMVDLAKESPVEWTAKEGDAKEAQSQSLSTEIRPLIQAYWLEDGPSQPVLLSPSSASTFTSVPRHFLTSSSSSSAGSAVPLPTLLDASTSDAQHLFYTTLHHIQPPYPTAEGWLKRKRGGFRSYDEFQGRGGVGPSDLEDDEEDGQGEDEGEEQDVVFFFPPQIEDAEGGGGGGGGGEGEEGE